MVDITESVSDIDVLAFERQQREFLHELQRKRILLNECREELNESIIKQQDLERQLTNEKRKNQNDELQSKLIMNAAKVLEDERHDIKKDQNQMKVQLEILTSERDALRDQTRNLQLDNIKLVRQVDELESKHRCHTLFQKDIIEQQNRIKSTISQFDKGLQHVQQKQEEVFQIHATIESSTNLQLVVKQKTQRMELATQQRDELEHKLISKTAELDKLKLLLIDSPVVPNEEHSIIEYWKTRAEELQIKLNHEIEQVVQLTSSLNIANDIQNKLFGKSENTAILPNIYVQDIETQTDAIVMDEIDLTLKTESIEF